MPVNIVPKIVQVLTYPPVIKLFIIGTVLVNLSTVPVINADQYAPYWNNPRYYRPGLFPTVEAGERSTGSCWSSWQHDRFNGLVEVRACD